MMYVVICRRMYTVIFYKEAKRVIMNADTLDVFIDTDIYSFTLMFFTLWTSLVVESKETKQRIWLFGKELVAY